MDRVVLKKTEQAIEHFHEKNVKAALRIASKFRLGLTKAARNQTRI